MSDEFEFDNIDWQRIVDGMNVSFGIFRFVPATREELSDIVLLYANEAYKSRLKDFGYDVDVLGDRGFLRSGGHLDPQMVHSIEDALYKRVQVVDKLYVTSMENWIEYFITPLDQENCYYIVIVDIDEEVRYLQEVERANATDALTGVGSRSALQEARKELGKKNVPLGVVVADLNGLKQVNDNEGHGAGDQTIARAASLLGEALPDWGIYRFGGDEFVVMAPGVGQTEFERLCAELEEAVAGDVDVSLSVGSAWGTSSLEVEALIHAADDAMYAVKREYYKIHDRRRI